MAASTGVRSAMSRIAGRQNFGCFFRGSRRSKYLGRAEATTTAAAAAAAAAVAASQPGRSVRPTTRARLLKRGECSWIRTPKRAKHGHEGCRSRGCSRQVCPSIQKNLSERVAESARERFKTRMAASDWSRRGSDTDSIGRDRLTSAPSSSSKQCWLGSYLLTICVVALRCSGASFFVLSCRWMR